MTIKNPHPFGFAQGRLWPQKARRGSGTRATCVVDPELKSKPGRTKASVPTRASKRVEILRLRLVFALSAQRPILAQDDNYKRASLVDVGLAAKGAGWLGAPGVWQGLKPDSGVVALRGAEAPLLHGVKTWTDEGVRPTRASPTRALKRVEILRLRLVFALSAQRPILAQDDNYKR